MEEYNAKKKCHCHGFKMILMDIDMPEMTGIEATKEIRKQNGLIPIVAVSAYTSGEDIEECLQSGMNDYSMLILIW